ncbi:hypothetical protein K523DRAFT_357819 [Schizophyllum commune Tattone D]|nr:hypothetical protein K523DRAFT_357819 [Schizophyllum commune Tattone D]
MQLKRKEAARRRVRHAPTRRGRAHSHPAARSRHHAHAPTSGRARDARITAAAPYKAGTRRRAVSLAAGDSAFAGLDNRFVISCIPGTESATVPSTPTPAESALTSAHPTEPSLPFTLPSTPPAEVLERPSTPVQSQQTTPASTPQKDGKRPLVRRKYGPARKGDLLKRIRAALERWRGVTRARDFPYSTLPVKALLSDQSLTKIASNNKIIEPSDLAALEPPWVYHTKYGVEVLALIQKVVSEFEAERSSNKKPRRTGRPKKTASQQPTACSPGATAAAEAKRTRAREREQARLAKAEREENKRLAKEARERAEAEKDARKALYAANYAKRHATPAPASQLASQTPSSSARPGTTHPHSSTSSALRYPLTPAAASHPALGSESLSAQGPSPFNSFHPRLLYPTPASF